MNIRSNSIRTAILIGSLGLSGSLLATPPNLEEIQTLLALDNNQSDSLKQEMQTFRQQMHTLRMERKEDRESTRNARIAMMQEHRQKLAQFLNEAQMQALHEYLREHRANKPKKDRNQSHSNKGEA